jgi:hypothetical protein
MTQTNEDRASTEQSKNNGANGSSAGADRQARLRALNDKLRIYGQGGVVVMTDGIAGLGASAVNGIFAAVAAFDDFNADNDPWGEHDCAVMTVNGTRIIWKIDYYDRSRRYHSPDAADPKVTVRVLTVMRADEY